MTVKKLNCQILNASIQDKYITISHRLRRDSATLPIIVKSTRRSVRDALYIACEYCIFSLLLVAKDISLTNQNS